MILAGVVIAGAAVASDGAKRKKSRVRHAMTPRSTSEDRECRGWEPSFHAEARGARRQRGNEATGSTLASVEVAQNKRQTTLPSAGLPFYCCVFG